MLLNSFKHALSVLALATLAACGGGDASTGRLTTPQAVGPRLVLNSGNYPDAATESASAADNMANSAGLATIAGVRSGHSTGLSQLVLDQLPAWLTQLAAEPPTVLGAAVPTTLRCASGSGRATFNDVNGNGVLDAGDAFNAVFNNCVLAGATLSGILAITSNTGLTGLLGSPAYAFDFTLGFTDLRVVDAFSEVVGNGSVRLISSRSSAGNGSDAISVSSMSLAETIAGVTVTRLLSNFNINVILQNNTESMTFSGVLTSSQLGGNSVQIATRNAFVTLPGNLYPSSGKLVASGANGATAALTAIDSTTAQIDLDADGNGTVDSTLQRSWVSIR